MRLDELDQYDGLGLANLIRLKEATPTELLDAVIERIETINPVINAIVTKAYDQARAAISAGLPEGPFAGVPFLLKDLTALCVGLSMTYGSRFFADYIPDHDSTIVARYRKAGLVICGKTNTPELGLNTTTEPVLFGKTRNPWNLDYGAGGSSGGSAAAVAARIVPMAHATDGGGSIRIPASCCGLVGLKPSRGRVTFGPDLGEGWSGASIGHAVTRTVRDSAALLDAVAGPDVGDPYWAPPSGSFLEEVGAHPGTFRIALCAEAFNGAPVDAECVEAAEKAARLCADLGHHVEEAVPRIERQALAEAYRIIVQSNVRAVLDARAAVLGRSFTADDIERATWDSAKGAESISGADYVRATQTFHRTGHQVARFLETYDLILTPTMACAPMRLGMPDMMKADEESYRVPLLRSIGFTSLFNATGNPAISLPLHWTDAGLPVGVQFAARFGDEAALYRIASQLETAHPWKNRRPEIG